MNGITDAINKLFGDIGGWSSYLLALVGLGTLTMAVLQTIKDTTPLRRWFQERQMSKWLKEHASVASKNLYVKVNIAAAERQLLVLATDGDARAFYDLEIEKLCGQWAAANQIIIDYPALYPDLAASVAARALKSDFDKLFARDLPDPLPPNVEARLDIEEQKRRSTGRQEFLDARSRVLHQIQRSVDSFQIDTAFRWKWQLQIASFGLSFLIAMIAMLIKSNWSMHELHLAMAIISAAIAGFLAPVARDLLAAIQKLRS